MITMEDTRAPALIARARARLIADHPFHATLALYLTPREDASTANMSTDGRTLAYNAAFVESLKPSELQGLIAHEVMHCAFAHHVRRGSRDPKRWNEACDHAVNLALLTAGFALPPGGKADPRFASMAAEDIYAQLAREAQAERPAPKPQGSPQAGAGKPGGAGKPSPASGAGATPAPGGGEVPGGVTDGAPEHDETAKTAEADAWKTRARQALAVARAANEGKTPGALERVDVETSTARVDWRDVLRRFIDESSVRDFAWNRPSRRMLAQGFMAPGMISDALARLVWVIDSSGSIDQRALAASRAEVSDALEGGMIDRLTVICCDTRVTSVHEYERGDVLDFKVTGGGGTRFAPAFAWISEHAPDASAVVYFTDLVCSDYGPEPAAPVLWAAWGTPAAVAQHGAKAPFGEVLHIAE